MITVTFIMTCFNRKDKTLEALRTLEECRARLSGWFFKYIVVDDKSTDGTGEALKKWGSGLISPDGMFPLSEVVSHGGALKGGSLEVVEGTGSLFYTGGMRLGIESAKRTCRHFSNDGDVARDGDVACDGDAAHDGDVVHDGDVAHDGVDDGGESGDYYVLMNDDVAFDSEALADMLVKYHCGYRSGAESVRLQENALGECTENQKLGEYRGVLVGPTRDSQGNFSYGGVRYVKGIHYVAVKPEDDDRSCDTFNANCVLVPAHIFNAIDNMDAAYNHSLGDFDYGLQIRRAGFPIMVYDRYIGVCDKNSAVGTWNDTSLSMRERLKKKESLKGLPRREWFHFLKKNFGFATACIKSVTPYVRIMLGR